MAKRLKLILILACCISARSSLAAGSSEDWLPSPYWGIGIIGPAKAEMISFPEKAIWLYDSPAGRRKYVIWKAREDQVAFGPKKGIIVGIVNPNDWIEVTYEGVCLKYYRQKDEYIQILIHYSPKGFWISAKELQKVGFNIVDWKSFLLAGKSGYYPAVAEKGLILREEPSIESAGIISLEFEGPEDYMITLTGKTEGLWAEVNVTTNGFYPCGDAKVKKRNYSGWVKLLDDKGFPNIWFYTRGC